MTQEEQGPTPSVWERLARPFTADQIHQYPGRGGQKMSYITAADCMQRLDDVLTPAGWDFEWEAVVLAEHKEVVKGRLTLHSAGIASFSDLVREDAGYPNSDNDEEPIKSAVSDALKRCAVHFGVGRHLRTDGKPGGAPGPQATPARQSAPRGGAKPSVDDLRRLGEPIPAQNGAPTQELLDQYNRGIKACETVGIDIGNWVLDSGATGADVQKAIAEMRSAYVLRTQVPA